MISLCIPQQGQLIQVNYVNVIIKKGGINSFTLDGVSKTSSFLPHPRDPNYYYASLPLPRVLTGYIPIPVSMPSPMVLAVLKVTVTMPAPISKTFIHLSFKTLMQD
jgi:hypothetical protein